MVRADVVEDGVQLFSNVPKAFWRAWAVLSMVSFIFISLVLVVVTALDLF